MQDPLVRLRQVAKSYGRNAGAAPVLTGIDLDIAAGEFLVIVGRSGSGKSTLLNLIGLVDTPDAGELWIGGRPLATRDEAARAEFRRAWIGFVFQFFNLIPTLTVGENLLLPLELNGRRGPGARARVRALLGEVGLDGLDARFPEELSGGEQQRVAIARAIVHTPPLVLADEPTGNLDLETAHQVLALLDRLCRQEGCALVMATHSREVIGLADRVLTIRDGRLVPEAP